MDTDLKSSVPIRSIRGQRLKTSVDWYPIALCVLCVRAPARLCGQIRKAHGAGLRASLLRGNFGVPLYSTLASIPRLVQMLVLHELPDETGPVRQHPADTTLFGPKAPWWQ